MATIISQIQLPSGNVYDLTDAGARALIQELMNYTDYAGVTTTELIDNVTTNPVIVVGDKTVTASAGTVATYESDEFIYSSTNVWQKFANLSGLGALAHKDSATGIVTPTGTVSAPTFTGDTMTSTGKFTPSGNISGGGVSLSKTTVTGITSVGTLPSATMPTFSVSNEVLTITGGSFSAGTLPTADTEKTVATDVETFTQPTFTGTEGNISVSGTPSGTNSAPTFNGNSTEITVS